MIGILGTHHGVGVTYTGLILAFYMSEELGKKTAFVECNRHRDMELIQTAYQWSGEDASSFSFHSITCYKEVGPERIAELYGEDYECIIFDFGNDLSSCREEFLRCSKKLIIGGRSEWELLKLIRFTEINKALRGSNTWQYLIPLATDQIIGRLRDEVGTNVWHFPAVEEPTIPNVSSNRIFRKLL